MRVNGTSPHQTAEYVICPDRAGVLLTSCHNPFLKSGQPVQYPIDAGRESCKKLANELSTSCSIAKDRVQQNDDVGAQMRQACGFTSLQARGGKGPAAGFLCLCSGVIVGSALGSPIMGIATAIGVGICLSSTMNGQDVLLQQKLSADFQYIMDHRGEIARNDTASLSSVKVREIVRLLAAANGWTIETKAKQLYDL